MFNKCSLLISLPDISKWDTENITTMNALFYKCRSLFSLPDISKWNTKNVKDIGYIFSECLIIVLNYHHYLIYQNGILQMLIL